MIDTGTSKTGAGRRILLVDNRPERRSIVRTIVESGDRGDRVVSEASTIPAAVAAVGLRNVDAAIIEVQMPIDVGLSAIAAIRAADPWLVIVVCSFHQTASMRRRAYEAGANAIVTKPVTARDLRAACDLPDRLEPPDDPSHTVVLHPAAVGAG